MSGTVSFEQYSLYIGQACFLFFFVMLQYALLTTANLPCGGNTSIAAWG